MGDREIMRYSPFAAHVGLELENMGDEQATVSLPWHDEIVNANGTAHGGAMFTMADVAMGLVARHLCPTGHVAFTRDMQIRYTRRAESGTLYCTATSIEHNKNQILLEAKIICADAIVCEVTGSYAYKLKG